MPTVYDQLIGAGAPAIKPPFAYNIEQDTDRYLRVQITMVSGRQVRMMSQRVVNLNGVNTLDVLGKLAAAANDCWNEIEATAGLDAIISGVVGSHGLSGSRPAAPFPTINIPAQQPAEPAPASTPQTVAYAYDPNAVQAADDPH